MCSLVNFLWILTVLYLDVSVVIGLLYYELCEVIGIIMMLFCDNVFLLFKSFLILFSFNLRLKSRNVRGLCFALVEEVRTEVGTCFLKHWGL